MVTKKRYMLLDIGYYDGDYDIEVIGFYDEWLDAVKHGSTVIIDLETNRVYSWDDREVRKAEKDFAWYMID